MRDARDYPGRFFKYVYTTCNGQWKKISCVYDLHFSMCFLSMGHNSRRPIKNIDIIFHRVEEDTGQERLYSGLRDKKSINLLIVDDLGVIVTMKAEPYVEIDQYVLPEPPKLTLTCVSVKVSHIKKREKVNLK